MGTDVSAPVDLLDVVQLYATTVLDREHGFSLGVLAVPPQDAPGAPLETVEDLAGALEMQIMQILPTPSASFLPHAIATVLLERDPEAAYERLADFLSKPPAEGLDLDPALLTFASFCAFTPILPLEQSPLEKVVLAAAIGASAPIAIAVAGSGVAVIGVAAGVVVVLAATAVFTEVVLARVDRWLRRSES